MAYSESYYGLNRFVCDVVEDIEKRLKILDEQNKSDAVMKSLVNELHILAKRMEARLEDASDLKELHEKIKEEKAELKKLRKKRKHLESIIEKKEALAATAE